jgi:hypothetical protein
MADDLGDIADACRDIQIYKLWSRPALFKILTLFSREEK